MHSTQLLHTPTPKETLPLTSLPPCKSCCCSNAGLGGSAGMVLCLRSYCGLLCFSHLYANITHSDLDPTMAALSKKRLQTAMWGTASLGYIDLQGNL